MPSVELSAYTPPPEEEVYKTKKMSPFDFVSAINETKVDLISDEETEKSYNPYLVNRQLSYFYDTIFFANEMNIHWNLDNKLQFDFLRLTIPRRKRFSKWARVEENELVSAMIELFKISHAKAREDAKLLSEEQAKLIIARADHGGLRKRK